MRLARRLVALTGLVVVTIVFSGPILPVACQDIAGICADSSGGCHRLGGQCEPLEQGGCRCIKNGAADGRACMT